MRLRCTPRLLLLIRHRLLSLGLELERAPARRRPSPAFRLGPYWRVIRSDVVGRQLDAYSALTSARSTLFKTTREEMKIPRCVAYLRLLPKVGLLT